jgi:sporulation protein YlmC with PRC-barrel domain
MRTDWHRIPGATVLLGLTLATAGVLTDQPEQSLQAGEVDRSAPPLQLKATEILGKEVWDAQNEPWGRVQDLIVIWETGTVPYALIARSAALQTGATITLLPFNALRRAADSRLTANPLPPPAPARPAKPSAPRGLRVVQG